MITEKFPAAATPSIQPLQPWVNEVPGLPYLASRVSVLDEAPVYAFS